MLLPLLQGRNGICHETCRRLDAGQINVHKEMEGNCVWC